MRQIIQKARKLLQDLKIRHKLLGIYLLATVLPILLVGAYMNYATRDVVLSNAVYEAESNVDKLEMRLDTILNRVTSISDLIYLSEDMQHLLHQEYLTNLQVYNAYNEYPIFDEYLKYYDEIENIQFHMSKQMITNSHFIHADKNTMQEKWYQQAVENKGKIYWVFKEEEYTGDSFLTLTRAIYDQDNIFLGVLSIYVSPDKLKEISIGELQDVFITLDEEVIVYHQDQRKIGDYPAFLESNEKSEHSNYVIDKHYEEKDVKINVHTFQPERALSNDIQVASIVPVEEIMQAPNHIFFRGFMVILAALSVSIFSIIIFIKTFNVRINTLKKAMFRVAKGKFNIKKEIPGKDEIGEVYDELYQTSQSIQKLIDEVYVHKIKEERWRRKQKETDFKMLSSQINPHFLYNTLEMIRMKALLNKDKEVAEIIQKLSKMMRSALERTDLPVPLKKEIDLVTTYLEIQTMRFGEKFSYQFELNCDIKKYQLFPLLIQPIVENAIIHGLEPKEGPGWVEIHVEEREQHLQVTVEDNGVGMSRERLIQVYQRLNEETDQPDGERIGVRNVHQRIQLYYGMDYGIEITSKQNEGTKVVFSLPVIKKKF
ncbi:MULTISPECIES: sensor histidine kinase [Paraliobacillus]|uniref:sensor histidine kinase n=1 Tax=Paraliobacillus TaxID=200903 RepID=UPI000DD4A1BF|nr:MULTISPECIES: sensor histidine kinase [Paraliobacillus]